MGSGGSNSLLSSDKGGPPSVGPLEFAAQTLSKTTINGENPFACLVTVLSIVTDRVIQKICRRIGCADSLEFREAKL